MRLNQSVGIRRHVSVMAGSELGCALAKQQADHANDQDAQFYESQDSDSARGGNLQVLRCWPQAEMMGVTKLQTISTKFDAYWQQPNVSWPASDPYVLAVGGTTLQIQDASGSLWRRERLE